MENYTDLLSDKLFEEYKTDIVKQKKLINYLFRNINDSLFYSKLINLEKALLPYGKEIIKINKNTELTNINENFEIIFNNEEFYNLKIIHKTFYIEKSFTITINIDHDVLKDIISYLNPNFTNLKYQFTKTLSEYYKLTNKEFIIDHQIYQITAVNYPEYIYTESSTLIINLIYDYFYELIKDKLAYSGLLLTSLKNNYLNKSVDKKIVTLIYNEHIDQMSELAEHNYKIINEINDENLPIIKELITPGNYLLVNNPTSVYLNNKVINISDI